MLLERGDRDRMHEMHSTAAGSAADESEEHW
jgi:hypothetical protein